MKTKTFTEGDFFGWHDRYKEGGGVIFRCLEIRRDRQIFFKVTFS